MQVKSEAYLLAEQLLILTISLRDEVNLENVAQMRALIFEREEVIHNLERLEIDENAARILIQVRRQEEKIACALEKSHRQLVKELAQGFNELQNIQAYLAS